MSEVNYSDPLTIHRQLHGEKVGVHRPEKGRVRITLPDNFGVRQWLRRVCGTESRPKWDEDEQVWTVAREYFRVVVEALAETYESVAVWVDVLVMHGCDYRCENADPDSPCECSCMGENHGGISRMRWIRVFSEEVAVGEKARRQYVVYSEEIVESFCEACLKAGIECTHQEVDNPGDLG